MSPLRLCLMSVLVLSTLPAATSARDGCAGPWPDEAIGFVRTDHAATGNRVAGACGPLAGAVREVELGGRPTWVLPDPTDPGRSWLVVFEDGRVDHVTVEPGPDPRVGRTELTSLPPGHPPVTTVVARDELVVGSALAANSWFAAPLPDSRVTEVAATALAALTEPTDRYPHRVLGDELEATAIAVRDADGLALRIEVADHEVIEGTSAMIVELVPDEPGPELLVTVSDADVGARLRVYDLEGDIVAESEPIGQGFRWLHQVAVAPLGPEGELEIIAVRTPHIGGVVEAYRLVGDRLERVAAIEGYSSHALGSANLDMALLADVDGDGRADVVVPTQDRRILAVLARTAEGFEELERLDLGGELATNVAASPAATGDLVLAAGTSDGRLHVFR